MRTVQEVLKTLNVSKLISTYINEYESVSIKDDEYNNIEQSENIQKTYCDVFFDQYLSKVIRLFKYIERLKMLEVKESNDMILAYMTNEYYYKINTSLIHYDDLMNNGASCETYAYEFCEQSEIMGWKLPETDFVNDNIYQIMSDILFEASFFGYGQEELMNAKNELTEAMQEVYDMRENIEENTEGHNLKSWDDVKKELNIVIEKDKHKDQLYHQLINVEYKYYNYLKEKELAAILQLIQAEQI